MNQIFQTSTHLIQTLDDQHIEILGFDNFENKLLLYACYYDVKYKFHTPITDYKIFKDLKSCIAATNKTALFLDEKRFKSLFKGVVAKEKETNLSKVA